MLSDSFKEKILSGMNYDQYLLFLSSALNELAEKERTVKEESNYKLLKLNNTRSERITKTYSPDNCTKELLGNITSRQVWLVISEIWCGDSAQIIPYAAKIASLNPLIKLKILFRDANSEIMDLYLTNGTRSIPILVGFDEEWTELFRWGPRPYTAHQLVKRLKEEGIPKSDLNFQLHLWYSQNKGEEIINEISGIIRKVINSEPAVLR